MWKSAQGTHRHSEKKKTISDKTEVNGRNSVVKVLQIVKGRSFFVGQMKYVVVHMVNDAQWMHNIFNKGEG